MLSTVQYTIDIQGRVIGKLLRHLHVLNMVEGDGVRAVETQAATSTAIEAIVAADLKARDDYFDVIEINDDEDPDAEGDGDEHEDAPVDDVQADEVRGRVSMLLVAIYLRTLTHCVYIFLSMTVLYLSRRRGAADTRLSPCVRPQIPL